MCERRFYRGFKHDAHPMAIMVGVAGALSAFYAKAADIACAPELFALFCASSSAAVAIAGIGEHFLV